MTNIIPIDYMGRAVRFNNEGWINATDIAKRYGKRPTKWLELPKTKKYMKSLSTALGLGSVRKSDTGLVRSSIGGSTPGTWLHPKLAVVFARWLDVDFAVWCDLKIDELIRGENTNLLMQYDNAVMALADAREIASLHGKGLNQWRVHRHALEQRVSTLAHKLQPMLPNI